MITPQQRNAWRGAYLRELRKIASTDILLDGWEDGFVFNNALEAHFAHFALNDLMVFCECLYYVFANHPIIVALSDKKFFNEDCRLSLDELYDYLLSLSNYAKDHVISFIQCNEETREKVFLSLKEEDKATFVDLAQSSANISEICLLCGYTYKAISASPSEYVIAAVDDDEERFSSLVKTHEEFVKNNGEEEIVNWLENTDDIIDLVRKYSMFDLNHLDVPLQEYYGVLVKLWFIVSRVVDGAFLDKELSVMNSIIIHSPSSELFSDLERLAFLLYGLEPERLFTPKSFERQELGLLKSEMPIKDSFSIPWLNDVEE